MSSRRYICSDLVTLHSPSGDVIVNLEEIWEKGAVIDCEQEPIAGEQVQIRVAPFSQTGARFSGSIRSTEAHEFGWRAEIAFSPLTPWSIEAFRPRHLLDIPEPGSSSE